MKITGLSFFLTAKHYHSHEYDSDMALLKNPIEQETKDLLISLFYKGYTPSDALNYIKENCPNYFEASKNRSIIPNLTDVYYLFKKEKIINFGKANINESAIVKFVDDNKSTLCIKYEFFEENYIIAFCTNKMLGSLDAKFISSNIICIDASGGMDKSSGHIFNLAIPGPAGALSVGMFLTFSETSRTIQKGISKLKEIWLENNIINDNFYPRVL